MQERKETLKSALSNNGNFHMEPESTADGMAGGGGDDHAHHRVVEARTTSSTKHSLRTKSQA